MLFANTHVSSIAIERAVLNALKRVMRSAIKRAKRFSLDLVLVPTTKRPTPTIVFAEQFAKNTVAQTFANTKNNAVITSTQNSATAVLQQPERVSVVLALLNNVIDEMNVIMVVNRSYCVPTQHRMQPCRLAILLMLDGEDAEHDNHLNKFLKDVQPATRKSPA